MAKHKRQHYFPLFYFRLFSNDGMNINIYNLNQKKHFRVPFKTQCSKSYFYGKNIELEKIFANIESLHAKIIRKIIKNKSLSYLTKEEYFMLLLFLLFQYSRTEREKINSKQITQDFVDEIIKPLIKSQLEFKKSKINPEDIDKSKITYPGDHHFQIFISLTAGGCIADLTPILIINNTEKDFIFSDSPMIYHNTYFNHLKGIGTEGFRATGLQIFCPLNKKLMLMLFDKEFYKLNKNIPLVPIKLTRDIDSLNSLQFFKANKNIYFSNKKQLKYVKSLHKKVHPSITKIKPITERIMITNQDGSCREILHLYEPNINFNLKLSFVGLKENKTGKFGDRNPSITEAYKKFMEELIKKEKVKMPKKNIKAK